MNQLFVHHLDYTVGPPQIMFAPPSSPMRAALPLERPRVPLESLGVISIDTSSIPYGSSFSSKSLASLCCLRRLDNILYVTKPTTPQTANPERRPINENATFSV